LAQISGAERGAGTRRYAGIGKGVTAGMAARGMYGAPAAMEAQRGVGRERTDVLMNLLSSQAQRTLQMIDVINRFGREEYRAGYESDVMRQQYMNQMIQQITGGAGAGAMAGWRTGVEEEFRGKYQEPLMEALMKSFGGGGTTPGQAFSPEMLESMRIKAPGLTQAGGGIRAPGLRTIAGKSIFEEW